MVFPHVDLSFIVHSKQNLNFYFQHHCPSWILNGPWYNTTICPRLQTLLFGYSVTTNIHYRYNLMCSIEDNER